MAGDLPQVQWITVDADRSGQRVDNFLLRELKGVPKSRVYRLLRRGEVRVNKGRVKAEYRLKTGDVVRVPPVRMVAGNEAVAVSAALTERLERAVVYEDDSLLVIDKPAGLAVHGGSGIAAGLIETLRVLRPAARRLELVHRLDRETSGLVMVAKRGARLRELHAALRDGHIDKRYLALVAGRWPNRKQLVDAPLIKFVASGERMAKVSPEGKASRTAFSVLERFSGATLVEARPLTGRTHQIRVHAQYAGHPLLGDGKYGDAAANAAAARGGLSRLFLHAAELRLPGAEGGLTLRAALDPVLEQYLETLRAGKNEK